MDDWFGCQYISSQSPIGEITGFKCRLLLRAVLVHYKKKSSVEECRTLRGIDTLCLPTFPCIIMAHSYMILKSRRDTFYK